MSKLSKPIFPSAWNVTALASPEAPLVSTQKSSTTSPAWKYSKNDVTYFCLPTWDYDTSFTIVLCDRISPSTLTFNFGMQIIIFLLLVD